MSGAPGAVIRSRDGGVRVNSTVHSKCYGCIVFAVLAHGHAGRSRPIRIDDAFRSGSNIAAWLLASIQLPVRFRAGEALESAFVMQ